MSKLIPLTRGYAAVVDNADHDWLMQWLWAVSDCGGYLYATRWERRQCIRMHRLLANAKPGSVIDHIDGNTLDNRRCNLRVTTKSGNGLNRVGKWTHTHVDELARQRGTSKYRGVSWDERRQKWRAVIRVNYRQLNLGRFDAEEDAAAAYVSAAREWFK